MLGDVAGFFRKSRMSRDIAASTRAFEWAFSGKHSGLTHFWSVEVQTKPHWEESRETYDVIVPVCPVQSQYG